MFECEEHGLGFAGADLAFDPAGGAVGGLVVGEAGLAGEELAEAVVDGEGVAVEGDEGGAGGDIGRDAFERVQVLAGLALAGGRE